MNVYYHPNPTSDYTLGVEESQHAIKVMRMQVGDELMIVDGKGGRYHASIANANDSKCKFEVISKVVYEQKPCHIHIAIAPTKRSDRLEWFVEKACELGVDQISIVQTTRTERKRVNHERLEKKAIGALKQSKNLWKCKVNKMVAFATFLSQPLDVTHRLIADVAVGISAALHQTITVNSSTLIVIGPEGGFAPDEVSRAIANGYQVVSMGKQVLRTETAGVIAVHTVRLMNAIATVGKH